MQLELRIVKRTSLQAVQLVAGLVQALMNGFELALHQRLHHVDAQFGDVVRPQAGRGAMRRGITQMAPEGGKRGPGWGKG
ncbi:hypothetical protein HQS1_60380 [Delftia lacustris]|nr:hypothetical protein HQS1_60380 [Delftia lacustris]